MATTLPRTGLTKPFRGERDWDDDVNAWWTKLDSFGGFADLPLTWSATQTFTTINVGTVESAGVLQLTAPLAAVRGRLVLEPVLQDVTADNTTLNFGTGRNSTVLVFSDSGTATDRTVKMPDASVSGEICVIVVVGGAIELLDDSTTAGSVGSCLLAGNWTGNTGSTLVLISAHENVSTINWYELSRSVN